MHPDNPMAAQFANMIALTELVATKKFTCCAVAGGAGLGKTYTVEQTLKRLGVRYEVFHGSGQGLMAKAYEYQSGGVLVLDDADNLVTGGGPTQANLMKQLCYPSRVRRISNNTIKAAEGKALTPPTFDTEVGIVWITNMALDLALIPLKMRTHIAALLSRGLQPVTLSDDPRWKLDYVLHLVIEENLLRNRPEMLSLVEVNEVVDYFVSNALRINSISVRAIEELATFRKNTPQRWRSIADGRLHPVPVHDFEIPVVPVIVPPSTKKMAA